MLVSMIPYQLWVVVRRDKHVKYCNYGRKELSDTVHGTPPFVILPFFTISYDFIAHKCIKNPRIIILAD